MKLRTPAQMRQYQRKRRALIKAGVWYQTDRPAPPRRAFPATPVTPRLTAPPAAIMRPAVPQATKPRQTASQPAAAPPAQSSLADRFAVAMLVTKLRTPAPPTVRPPPGMTEQPRQAVIDPAAAPPKRVVTVPKGAPMPSPIPGIEFVRQR
jgi:hypothetical protein